VIVPSGIFCPAKPAMWLTNPANVRFWPKADIGIAKC